MWKLWCFLLKTVGWWSCRPLLVKFVKNFPLPSVTELGVKESQRVVDSTLLACHGIGVSGIEDYNGRIMGIENRLPITVFIVPIGERSNVRLEGIE